MELLIKLDSTDANLLFLKPRYEGLCCRLAAALRQSLANLDSCG